MAVRMHSKETMIDTRPGTSTVGVQCSIWEKPPEQQLPWSMGASIPSTEVGSSSEESAVGGGIVLQRGTVFQDDQLVNQCNINHNLDHGMDVTESESIMEGEASSSPQDKIPAIDDASYSLMVDVLRGQFNIPVKERTQQHKSVIVQLWRNRGKFTVNDCNPANLYYNGKCVPRKSQHRKFTSRVSEGKTRGRVQPLKRTLGEEFVASAERNICEELRNDQRQDSMQTFRSNTSQNSNPGRNSEAQASPRKQQNDSSPQNDLDQFPVLDESSYSLIVDILKGQFKIPIEKRTKQQKSAIIRLWRNKGKYTVDDCNPPNLYYNGKCVQRKT